MKRTYRLTTPTDSLDVVGLRALRTALWATPFCFVDNPDRAEADGNRWFDGLTERERELVDRWRAVSR